MSAIPAPTSAEAAHRMAAPSDDELANDDIGRSRLPELITAHLEKLSHDDRVELITNALTDPMLSTAIINMAIGTRMNLGQQGNAAWMCRLAATAGDAIRQKVEHEYGDDLVATEAQRLREEE